MLVGQGSVLHTQPNDENLQSQHQGQTQRTLPDPHNEKTRRCTRQPGDAMNSNKNCAP